MELKTCPFCGKGGVNLRVISAIISTNYAVMCQYCMAYGPPAQSIQGAVNNWDTRCKGEDDEQ